MANEFDTLASELVAELTPAFAKALTFVSVAPGTYNPSTGATTAPTESTTSVRGNIIQFTLDEIDGVKVEQGDFKVIVYYTGEIDLNDKLRFDSKNYRMINVLDKYYAVENVFGQVVQCRYESNVV